MQHLQVFILPSINDVFFQMVTCPCCRCINGKDFRAQQCENEFFIAAPGNKAEAGQQNWIPFEHTDNEFKCKLACYNRDTKVKNNILNTETIVFL